MRIDVDLLGDRSLRILARSDMAASARTARSPISKAAEIGISPMGRASRGTRTEICISFVMVLPVPFSVWQTAPWTTWHYLPYTHSLQDSARTGVDHVQKKSSGDGWDPGGLLA